ncbi:MAG: AbrB/MazE/SpoVT family DNA-binding domain-containing protein [Gammaproteobacteria bacterium]|nr:AbrB/MazE/SpoVT family DNA-binding domain-containing protein [Gammaproteobacteria bacterium]
MSSATLTLSNTGQISIPQEIRDELHWEPGLELTLETTDSGVVLRSKAKKRTLRLEDLRGFLKCDGPPVSIEALCEPVDYTADWEMSEKRGR